MARTTTTTKRVDRIPRYIKEKKRLVRAIDKDLRPMFENLFDDLKQELTPLWPTYQTVFTIVGRTLAMTRQPNAARQWRPQAVNKAKAILKHYERHLGIKLVDHGIFWRFDKRGMPINAILLEFAFPKFQAAVKRKVGDTPAFGFRCLITDGVQKLASTDIVGMNFLDVADVRIVKAQFDAYWALRASAVSVIKVHP